MFIVPNILLHNTSPRTTHQNIFMYFWIMTEQFYFSKVLRWADKGGLMRMGVIQIKHGDCETSHLWILFTTKILFKNVPISRKFFQAYICTFFWWHAHICMLTSFGKSLSTTKLWSECPVHLFCNLVCLLPSFIAIA